MGMSIMALAAGTATSAVGSIMQGQESARAARFEQQQYAAQEQVQRTQAAQAEARKREELVSSLGSIQAIRAGRGVGLSSPTGMAILDSTTSVGVRDARQAGLNYLMQADQSRMAGAMAGQKAKYSLLSGWMGAGSALADGAFAYDQLSDNLKFFRSP